MHLIYRTKQLMLALGDMISFCFAFWFSLFIRKGQAPDWQIIASHVNLFFILFLVWLIINYINTLYDLSSLKDHQARRNFLEAGIMSLFLSIILLYILSSKNIAPKTILILNIAIGYGLSYIWRLIFNKYINAKTLQTNVIFVGFNNEANELIKILQRYPERGYKTVALIDSENELKPENFPFFDVYHGLKTLRPAITNHEANLVVIAPHLKDSVEATRELYELLFWNVKIIDISSFYESITGRIPPSTFSESWFLEHLQVKKPIYEKCRLVYDYLAGIIMGATFIILLPFISLAIKFNSKGSIFFTQRRVGKYGTEFNLYKFRSMYSLAEDGSAEIAGAEFAQKGDKRITAIGKFLRQTRLDEIPQFINLLKGDISLIGPRPERPEIVEQLKTKMPYYNLRHIIKPGLTGWAAVHQHYTDTLESSLQKLQYDLFYIKNRSLLLDLSIALKTINVVLKMMGQ